MTEHTSRDKTGCISPEFSMPEQAEPKRICPYLGLADGPDSRFTYPEDTHLCFSADLQNSIPLEHQAAFCLTQRYPTCPRFVELPAEPPPVQPTVSAIPELEVQRPVKKASLWGTVLLGLVGLLAGLLIIFGIYYYSRFASPPSSESIVIDQPVPTPTASPTVELILTEDTAENTPTPVAVALLPTPTPTVTPASDFKTYTLSPAETEIGWITSGEERGNHFGDSFLYAGIFEGQIYNGAFQFDLSTIPRGAPIEYAAIQMTGLRDDRLDVHSDRANAGVWTLRMLASEIDQDWRRHNFQDIFNVSALYALSPILSVQDLAAGKTNEFELSSAQIKTLEERIIDDENPKISFRIEGPLVGPDNLFGWDTGYGPQTGENRVILSLHVGLPPATPPPYDYVLVTSTPTPENVVTAAAIAMQMTADATRIGTVTPVPPNMVTPTPIPDYLVFVPVPTPANKATARAFATTTAAEALTTGTPPPMPTGAVTATPTPTETPTPIPVPPNYVIITSTPTAETIFAAATIAVEAKAQAQIIGTPTPLPADWVTPVVVTATPTPRNEATAQALIDLATAMAVTTGTPTPLPSNVMTATPTPVYNRISLILTPTPRPPTDVTPESMPPALLGKILFRSDREWSEEERQAYQEGRCAEYPNIVCFAGLDTMSSNRLNTIYVFDPETGELGRLTADWPYHMGQERDVFSADTVYRAYTKQLLWTSIVDDMGNRTPTTEVAIHYYDYKYKEEKIVTRMGVGIVYDPAWSPVSNEIAFVANESQNDEIWIINYDGAEVRQLTHNEWEWDKSPSWSPDGKQIVFASNRTGNLQLWVMNADGSDQRLLMGWDNWTPYNDWAPIWVKYPDPAPPEEKKR
jgi:hypothetical protein